MVSTLQVLNLRKQPNVRFGQSVQFYGCRQFPGDAVFWCSVRSQINCPEQWHVSKKLQGDSCSVCIRFGDLRFGSFEGGGSHGGGALRATSFVDGFKRTPEKVPEQKEGGPYVWGRYPCQACFLFFRRGRQEEGNRQPLQALPFSPERAESPARASGVWEVAGFGQLHGKVEAFDKPPVASGIPARGLSRKWKLAKKERGLPNIE